MERKVYRELASLINAKNTCEARDNQDWYKKHSDRIEEIMKSAPSGSGIDCGTTLVEEDCTDNKLVFQFSFHHMDQNGMYCGWSEHTLTVTPSLMFDIELDFDSNFDGADVESLIGYDEFAEEEDLEEEREITEEDLNDITETNQDYFHDVYHYWLTGNVNI